MATHYGYRPTDNSPTIARSFSNNIDIEDFKTKANPNKKYGASEYALLDFTKNHYYVKDKMLAFDDTFTHSRNGNATMVDSDGIVKWAHHNFFAYSEDFSNSYWNKSGVTLTTGDSYEGVASTRFTVSALNERHRVSRGDPFTVSGNVLFRVAAIAKRNSGWNYLTFTRNSPGFAGIAFNLSTGVVDADTISNGTTGMTDLGGGWYLCYMDCELNSFTDPQWTLRSTTNVGPDYTELGDGSTNFDILATWAYRKDSLSMVQNPAPKFTGITDYKPTTTTNTVFGARINHYENNENKGLLLETDAATNLIDNSVVTDANWSTFNGSITDNAAVAPDGNTIAGKFVEDTSTNLHRMDAIRTSFTATDTYRYVYSVWLKAAGRDQVQIQRLSSVMQGTITGGQPTVIVDLTAGTATSTDTDCGIIAYGSGWYRVWLAWDQVGATGNYAPIHYTISGGTTTYTGDGTSGYYAWGGQIEQTGLTADNAPTWPSSYIPTTGATATRTSETLNVNAANVPWSTTAMSWVFEGEASWEDSENNNEVCLFGRQVSSDNYLRLSINTVTPRTGALYGLVRNSAVNETSEGSSKTPAYRVPLKAGLRFTTTDLQVVDAGEAAANQTEVGGTIYDYSAEPLYIGGDNNVFAYNGTIQRLYMWNKDVGSEVLQAETWHPTSLFANSEVGYIWDLSDRETVFSDAGTTAATANDNIEYIADLSPNGYNGTQTTESFGPRYIQDAAGNWGMKFDGTDDHLDVTAMPVIKTFCIAYKLGDGETQGIFYYRGSGDFVGAFDDNSDVTTSNDYGTSSLRVNGIDLTTLTRGELYNALASGKNKNSVLLSEHTGAAGTGVASVGFYGGGYALTGTIYAIVAIDRYLTEQEKLNLETWVSNRSSARMYTGI